MGTVFFGGAGAMGSRAAKTAGSFDELGEIVIADRDGDAAEKLARQIGPRARAVGFDAETDDAGRLLVGATGVVNTLGPFTRFGVGIMEAAIECGCHYVDINDDWEPTLTALSLDERARRAGVTALIGMGASPGITNLLAACAVAELDEPVELLTGWALAGTAPDLPAPRISAAMLHFVHQSTGTIRVLDDGSWTETRPLARISLSYPGIGRITTRTIGHPEAITLPIAYPGLMRCLNVMSGPEWYFDLVTDLMSQVDRGELDAAEAAAEMERPHTRPADAPPTVHTPTLWAWAAGHRRGRRTVVGVGLDRRPSGNMAGSTGVPAAVAMRLLARGEIAARGVVTPERAVPVDLFFAQIDPFCTDPPGATGQLVSVSVMESEFFTAIERGHTVR